jgi:hypothetical protein
VARKNSYYKYCCYCQCGISTAVGSYIGGMSDSASGNI